VNLKYMIAAGAILFSCTVSADTAAGSRAYNSSLGDWDTRLVSGLNAQQIELYRISAEQGDASAQFKMALMYDRGKGMPQDYSKAVKWLRKSAEQDFVKAQYNLGCMYDSGLGVSQDHAEATKWYRKAAERGFASAQKNLGAQYGLGQGVPQNDGEAFVWSSIAAISGDEGAVNNRDFAASKLSSENLYAAQKRATKLYEEIQQRKEVQ